MFLKSIISFPIFQTDKNLPKIKVYVYRFSSQALKKYIKQKQYRLCLKVWFIFLKSFI